MDPSSERGSLAGVWVPARKLLEVVSDGPFGGGGSREVPALGRVGLHPGQEFKFSKGEGVQGWKRVGEKESAGWLALLFQINAPNPDWLGPMVEEQSQQPLEAVVQFYGTLLPSSSGGGSEESGRGWGHACQNGQSFNP